MWKINISKPDGNKKMGRLRRWLYSVKQDLWTPRVCGWKENTLGQNQWRNTAEEVKACTVL